MEDEAEVASSLRDVKRKELSISACCFLRPLSRHLVKYIVVSCHIQILFVSKL